MKTALERNVYAELATIVGATNLSEDNSVVLGYAWNGLAANPGANRLSSVWPSAIVMPGHTNEVAAVIKCCVQHGVHYRPISTGVWSTNMPPGHYIIMDLRRMNRCEIDVKNQMAVIEPHVTAGQLQAEAVKSGLTCHVVGAGPPHSPLASATSVAGIGITGATTGINFRNLLALEWVTPTGEIHRIGSCGSGDAWFTGEGPGPGFRGMIRGDNGAYGGLGVFTKIGFKLHPWKTAPGPVSRTGSFPQLGMPLTSRERIYHLAWDTWEDAADAAIAFNKSRIADYWVRIPPDSHASILTTTNNEFLARRTAGTLPHPAREENTRNWTVMTLATSDAEARYKEKVMARIIADTRARVVPLTEEEVGVLARNFATSAYVLRVYRPTFGGVTSMGILDSFRLLPKVMNTAASYLEADAKRGHYISADAVWAWSNEGRYMWAENVPVYSTNDKPASAAALAYFVRMMVKQSKDPVGMNGFAIGPVADFAGMSYGNSNDWMRKIKNHYDPQDLAISQHYITTEKSFVASIWPFVGKIVASGPFQPVLKTMMEGLLRKAPN